MGKKELPRYLDIIFTSDMFGEVDPCGCVDRSGGLARRASFIKTVYAEAQKDTGVLLLLDAGGLTDTEIDPWDTLKTELAVKIYRKLQYHAVTLGITDLLLGKHLWQELLSDLDSMFISVNIQDATNGQSLLKPSQLIILENLRIGVIAAIDPNLQALLPSEMGFKLGDINPTLESEVSRLRPNCEILVLLAHCTIAQAKSWATLFPQFDVVIGGHDTKRLFEPEVVEVRISESEIKDIPICFSGVQAKSPGEIRLFINPQSGQIDSFRYTLVPMDDTYPKDVWIDSILAVGKWQNYQRFRFESEPLEDLENAFVGSQFCAECHQLQYRQWSNSAHAQAMETLEESNDPYNLECLSCHVTGWGKKSGFAGHAETPKLVNVGCEECHGPGKRHLERKGKIKLQPIDDKICLRCHNEEQSPQFDYQKALIKVKH